jgi:hypothetical protein
LIVGGTNAGRLKTIAANTLGANAVLQFTEAEAAAFDATTTQDPAPGSGVLLDLVTTTTALTVTAPPGGTYFSADAASAPSSPPLLRALVRNTGTAQAAIALTVTAVVLAP